MNSVLINKYRITPLSPSLVRVEYSEDGSFYDEYPVFIEPDFPDFNYKKRKYENRVEISTHFFKLLLIADGSMLDSHNLKIKLKGSKWKSFGDVQNMGGATLDLFKYPDLRGARIQDGIISKDGVVFFRYNTEFLWDKKNNWVKSRHGVFQDIFIFAYGRNYKKAFEDFIRLSGRPAQLPAWAFGYWYSIWKELSQDEIIATVKKFRDYGIPIDVFVIDTDFRKHKWTGYEFDKNLFYDFEKFIKTMRDLNVRLGLNDHPGYDEVEPLPEDDPYIKILGKRKCDWFNKEDVLKMKEILRDLLNKGIDFFWIDGWGGRDKSEHENQWLLNKIYFEVSNERIRSPILSRWGGPSSHRYPVYFTGDTYSNFETLAFEVKYTHIASNILAYTSNDIGGFFGNKIDEKLYIRWLEYGALSPVFRTHSNHGVREPWNYSLDAVRIFKKYTLMRYSLFPYIYSHYRIFHETGLPVFRGVYIDYPVDEYAYRYLHQYLIGDAILVAPCVKKNDEVSIYLPGGRWFDVEGKKILKGRSVLTKKVPLDRIPFFIKIGSIIPSTTPGEFTCLNDYQINVFPDKTGFFEIYEDDFLTNEYMYGKYVKQKISYEVKNKKLKIYILPAKGSYSGYKENMQFKFNVFNFSGTKVLVDGMETHFIFSDKVFTSINTCSFLTFSCNLNRNIKHIIEIFSK